MATDLTPRDDVGRPMDYERHRARMDRELAAAEELRVERLLTVDESMVHLIVLDHRNRIRGALALSADAITTDDPQWLLERVQRTLRPDLKIVG